MSFLTLHVLCVKLFLKLRIALLIGSAENCLISSPVRLSIQNLLWALDEGFKIPSCVTPQTRYIHGIQIWRVIRWPLFHFNNLRTVLLC